MDGHVLNAVASAALAVCACASSPTPEVGVLRRAGDFEKEPFFENTSIGDIRSISVGRLDRDSLEVVVISGTNGAAVVTPNGALRRTVGFDRPVERAFAFDMDHDGSCEFMGRGGDGRPVVLLNSSGKTIWELARIESRAPVDMTAADLDGDGVPEYIVAFAGNGGIRVMNDTATERSRWDVGNTGHVEAADIDRDGRPEILCDSGEKPGIVVRDAAGKTIRTIKGLCAPFAVCRGFRSDDEPLVLAAVPGKKAFRLVDFTGAVSAELPVSAMGRYPCAVRVRFGGAEPPCIALSLSLSGKRGRSLFTVFDAGGNALYEEVCGTPYCALAVAADDAVGVEMLLAGPGAAVWKFKKARPPG